MVPECCVATWAFVLVLRHEEPLAAAGTRIDACVLGPPICSGEWPLGACTLSDEELVRSKLLLELVSDLSLVLGEPLLIEVLALESARLAIRRCYAVVHDCAISLDSHVLQLLLKRPDTTHLNGRLLKILNDSVSLHCLLLDSARFFLLFSVSLGLLCSEKPLHFLLTGKLLLSLLGWLGRLL